MNSILFWMGIVTIIVIITMVIGVTLEALGKFNSKVKSYSDRYNRAWGNIVFGFFDFMSGGR